MEIKNEDNFVNFLKICYKQFNIEADERHKIADECLEEIFHRWKGDDKLLHIFARVAVLDALYNTRINDPNRMARRIMKIEEKINKKIESGDITAIEDIRHSHEIHSKRNGKIGNEIDLYSFATKYCHWQSKGEYYPIYDRVIGEVIWKFYEPKMRFEVFKKKHLDDYSKFIEYIAMLKTEIGAKHMDFRKFDHALWILGKFKGLGSENPNPTLSEESLSLLSTKEEELNLDLDFLKR